MIGSKVQQIQYAAQKLVQQGVVFPIDKEDAAYDIAAIVTNNILLTVVEIDDNFPGTIITRRNLQKVLEDVVYDCQFVYNKPVVALFDEDDEYLYYAVYDADGESDSCWPN